MYLVEGVYRRLTTLRESRSLGDKLPILLVMMLATRKPAHNNTPPGSVDPATYTTIIHSIPSLINILDFGTPFNISKSSPTAVSQSTTVVCVAGISRRVLYDVPWDKCGARLQHILPNLVVIGSRA
jgi:hypothetical protein